MVKRVTTVITPADSYDLVSIEDLKTDLSITGSADDDYLARAISKASLAASQYCDRVLVAEYVEDRFDFGWGSTESVKLSHYPVISVDTVAHGDVELVEDVDYRVDAPGGRIYPIGGCWWGGKPLVVTYEGGYEEIPLDLQSAATDIVKAMQFNRTRDPMLRSENILSGLYAYTLFDASAGASAGTAMQVRHVLDSYRSVTV